MSDEDTAVVKGLAATAKALYDERKALEGYITSGMEELAPNLSKVLGPLLGARLMARAGGIDKLAKMPASTIQVMGAGDALFKHLRTGTPSPKHGLIFKHPLILGSPKAARGTFRGCWPVRLLLQFEWIIIPAMWWTWET